MMGETIKFLAMSQVIATCLIKGHLSKQNSLVETLLRKMH